MGEIEGEKHWCEKKTSICASCMCPNLGWTLDPRMFPDWEYTSQGSWDKIFSVIGLLILPWKICIITTDKVPEDYLFLLSASTNIGLGSCPDIVHHAFAFLSLFSWGLFISPMSCKSYVWGFSLYNLWNNNHDMASVLPPRKWVLNLNTEMASGVAIYILVSFSKISFLCDLPIPGLKMLLTMCFWWSSLLVVNILLQILTWWWLIFRQPENFSFIDFVKLWPAISYTYLFVCLFIYLFIEGGGREKERTRNINVWLPFTGPLLETWPATQACALMGGSNWWPFGLQASTQPTEPLQPGQKS